MPPVSQRYRDARRRQIIAAARRCFARAGFHGTSMQDVFVESGLSAGAVYGYFDGKDDLISAIIDEVLSEITGALDAVIDSASPPPPGAVLGQVFQALDHGPHGTEFARLAVQVWGEAGRSPELGARLAGHYRQMRERFTTLVQRYQRDDTLDPSADPRHLAQVLTALGPAFLAQRALLEDVTAESFTRGLCALLAPRRDPSAPARQEAAPQKPALDSPSPRLSR